jgi:RimJ/RimL family protein N-acetyltransferase
VAERRRDSARYGWGIGSCEAWALGTEYGLDSGPTGWVNMIETPRLLLRPWSNDDGERFAAMSADAEVMHDLGGPITRSQSDAKLARYAAALEQSGLSRWAVEGRHDGEFLGYAGVLHRPDHAIGAHFDLAWRLVRAAWGHGYATEAASASLNDAFTGAGLTEILAYTSPDNQRSQAVMARLMLRRDPSRDFEITDGELVVWTGLVWVAQPG